MTRVGEILFDDEKMHNQTTVAMLQMIVSGIFIGSHLTESEPLFLGLGIVIAVIALRIHPGSEKTAQDWIEVDDDDNWSDRL